MVKKDKKDASFSGIDDEGDEVKFTLEQEIRLIQENFTTHAPAPFANVCGFN